MSNQKASVSMVRASIWREEATVGVKPAAMKRPMGFQTLDLPPILSSESLFTRAIPLGMQNMPFCRTPSNRIGIYNSPATMDIGNLDVKMPKIKTIETPTHRFDLPNRIGQKRPWRHSDVKPSDLMCPYKMPFLCKEELDFLAGECLHSESPHIKIREDITSHMNKEEFNSGRKCLNDEFMDKEDFFPHIVQSPRSLHVSSCLEQQSAPSDVSEAAERILKYQYYIEAGIDETCIAPIRERWIKNALHHVGKHAIEGLSQETVGHTLQHVSEEVHHEYVLSMRKAIVNYILQDKLEQERLGLIDIEKILQVIAASYFARPHTIQILLPEWRSAVLNAHGVISGSLYRLHPLALEIANIWQTSFANKLFFDVNSADFRAKMPFGLDAFISKESMCIANVKDSLEKEWFALAGNLLKQAVPISPHQDLDGFYNSMSVLMTNQIRRLVEDSIVSFTRFFAFYIERMMEGTHTLSSNHSQSPENYEQLFEDIISLNEDCSNVVPPFVVTLKYHNGVYSVDPTFVEIENGLLKLLDLCSFEGSEVSFTDSNGKKTLIFANIQADNSLVNVAKQYIKMAVYSNSEKPMSLVKCFELFEDLANMHAENFAKEFKAQEKNLADYEATIEAFTKRSSEAAFASSNNVDCGFVRVQCIELKDSLSDKANHICTLLKEQILAELTAANHEVSIRCERIARDITKVSTNSEEAVTLQKLLFSCPNELAAVEKVLAECRQKDEFLEKVMYQIPDTEFRTMMLAYEWPKRVRAVVEVHAQRIQEEYEEYELDLKKRRTIFLELLESYDAQVRSFEKHGEIEKAEAISMEAQALSSNLEAAQVTSENMNSEEQLFGMAQTKFIQIQQMVAALDPFLKLWKIAGSFRKYEDEWMSCPFFSVDIEKIENEV